ncbi:MAG: type III pantothenate kinase [Vulcanimicrobiota bacterium]
MYLLAVDVGNTNIVMGVYRDDKLQHHWRIHTDREKFMDEYGELFDSFLEKKGIKNRDINQVAISNVVPSLQSLFENLSANHFNCTPFFINHKNKLNFEIRIENPAELGADLIAAASSSIEFYGVPSITLDLGTATTFTVVNKNRELLGGVIAPGLNISQKALYSQAPHLPVVKLENPPSVIGNTTEYALQAGLFTGYLHMIKGLIADIKQVIGSDAVVIATGGLAQVIRNSDSIFDVLNSHLVLDGIRFIYNLNKKTAG